MKTRVYLSIILILAIRLSFAQVGINTTNPTKDLDINGELRIRNLPTQTGSALIAADKDGNIGKLNAFMISDVNTTVASKNVDVTITPSPIIMVIDNIDLGLSTTVTIPAHTDGFVIITYSVPIGISTFTTPRGYYGIRFLKNGIEAPGGSRKFSIIISPTTSNMASVSATYTEKFVGSPMERTIVYTLNGYIEQIQDQIDHTFRFNMWATSGDNFNWGRAAITKQVYLR